VRGKAEAPTIRTLSEYKDRYLQAIGLGAMEANSLDTVKMHRGHFVGSLGAHFPIQTLKLDHLQEHVEHWLVTGRGPRFLEGEDDLRSGQAIVRPKVPVAKELLPGRPSDHPNDWDEPSSDPLGVLTPTQYWLEVKRSDFIVRHKEQQIRPGDWLLLETDPLRFPSQDSIDGKLVVVPGSFQGKSRAPELARVMDVGDDRLEVVRFDLGIDPALLEEEIVLRRQRDGSYRGQTRKVMSERAEAKGRRSKRLEVVHPGEPPDGGRHALRVAVECFYLRAGCQVCFILNGATTGGGDGRRIRNPLP
jgi:hypothetical protein